MEDNQNDKKYIIEIKSLYVSTNAFGNVYSFTKT